MYSRNLSNSKYTVPEHYSGTAFRRIEDKIYRPSASSLPPRPQAHLTPTAMSETASKGLYSINYPEQSIYQKENEDMLESEADENITEKLNLNIDEKYDSENLSEEDSCEAPDLISSPPEEPPSKTVEKSIKSKLPIQIENDDILLAAVILMMLDRGEGNETIGNELVLLLFLLLFMK